MNERDETGGRPEPRADAPADSGPPADPSTWSTPRDDVPDGRPPAETPGGGEPFASGAGEPAGSEAHPSAPEPAAGLGPRRPGGTAVLPAVPGDTDADTGTGTGAGPTGIGSGAARPAGRRRLVAVLAAVLVLVVLAVAGVVWSMSRPGPTVAPPAAAGPGQLTIWLTGYSWQDNTPPGSSIVGEPVLHKEAGGQGTFADPITVAVPGHQGNMAWKPGTKFYLPTVQRYVIVEDSGAAKQPSGTDTHLDMWIGGQDGTKQETDDCESTFTGRVPAQVNPPDNLPVTAGSIFGDHRCDVPAQPANLGTYDDSDSSDGDSSDGDSSDSDSNDDSDDSGDSGGGHHHRHHDSDDDNGSDDGG